MKVASLRDGSRDGKLVLVSRDLSRAAAVPDIAPTLQAALDDWASLSPQLGQRWAALEEGKIERAFPFDQALVHSPLPRAFQWCEGSVFLVHLERCRRATGRELPALLYEEIGMYQGGSDSFLPPQADIPVRDDSWDVDLEAGICAITDDVPMGISVEHAARHIKLLLLTNDVSLRGLQGAEAAKGLGAIQCKPANSFSPVAVTPAGLGDAWTGTMLSRQVRSFVNGTLIGAPFGDRDAHFEFPHLIAHLARTRNIAAGSIIGVGTVANRDASLGSSCLLEKRSIELVETGKISTPFLKYGDRIRIESIDDDESSIFGAIDQRIVRA